jgi:chromosome segregation ATPase
LRSAKELLLQERDNLVTSVSHLRQELSEKRDQISVVISTNTSLRLELNSREITLAEERQRFADQTQQIANCERELASLRSALSQKESRISELHSELSTVNEEMSSYMDSVRKQTERWIAECDIVLPLMQQELHARGRARARSPERKSPPHRSTL